MPRPVDCILTDSPQTTLAAPARVSGVGLHSGEIASVSILPANTNAGVVFRRVDMGDAAPIPAHPKSVTATRLGTTLSGADGTSVATVEHLMCALAAAGIDNALVEVSGPELPILDGSAAPYIAALDAGGVVGQSAARRALAVRERIALEDGDRSLAVVPAAQYEIDIEIEFSDAAIGRQHTVLSIDGPTLRERIAPARTFCRSEDLDMMRAAGLAKGGSLDNAVVVEGAKVLNPAGLSYEGRDRPDLFVHHKALDLVGDLRLLGMPIIGRIVARRPGHDLNTRFAKLLAEAAGL